MCKLCEKPDYCKGLCKYHYAIYNENDKSRPKCSVDSCDKRAIAKGMCGNHYRQFGRPKSSKMCSVNGCFEDHYAKSFCKTHHRQFLSGILHKHHKQTPNDISIFETHAEIIIRSNKHKLILKYLIDLEDIEKCSKYKWCLTHGYANNSKIGGLHRLVLNAQKGELVDHISRNKLDCRKFNLRIANKSINSQNSKIVSTNTSGFTGVFFHKINKKWIAQITINRKRKHLGCFNTPEEAAKEYNKAAEKHYGRNAKLNKVL